MPRTHSNCFADWYLQTGQPTINYMPVTLNHATGNVSTAVAFDSYVVLPQEEGDE